MGHGITDAFRDAELLVEALHAGLSGQRPLEEALAGYEQQRSDVSLPIYELNSQFAAQEPPPPQMLQLFTALHGNQADTDRFFATLEGTISPTEFFSPENVGQIIAKANLKMPQ